MALPLYVLSGIGGDERLFEPQRRVRDIRPIRWIPPTDGAETVARYAERLARELPIEGPFELGGSSFGGMVALELARHLRPERVFLFGSCRSPEAVAPMLRLLRHAGPVVPDALLHPPPLLQPPVARWFGARSSEHVQRFAEMLAATPPAFIRWASRAVFSWEGVAQLPMPVRHIHGARDRLIPAARVQADRIVPGAGHLLNLTDGDAVNEFLRA